MNRCAVERCGNRGERRRSAPLGSPRFASLIVVAGTAAITGSPGTGEPRRAIESIRSLRTATPDFVNVGTSGARLNRKNGCFIGASRMFAQMPRLYAGDSGGEGGEAGPARTATHARAARM